MVLNLNLVVFHTVLFFCCDLELFSMQTCLRLLKYDLISLWAVPFIPYFSNFCRRIQWSTVSNAFSKSRKRTPLISPLSIFNSH